MVTAYALGSVALVSIISLIGVVMLSLREKTLQKLLFLLVGLATGALFGDALIHLIPEALAEGGGTAQTGTLIMGGILFFFLLEKIFLWRHRHVEDAECIESIESHDHTPKSLAPLILVADFFHNLLDGVIIGASYLVSIPVGISTTIAVILHEIPQEIGDFGLFIHAGWSRGKALMWNFLSAFSAVIGVVISLSFGATTEGFIPVASALTAGAFLYIAGSDLVPELHRTSSPTRSVLQIVSIAVGFAVMYLLSFVG